MLNENGVSVGSGSTVTSLVGAAVTSPCESRMVTFTGKTPAVVILQTNAAVVAGQPCGSPLHAKVYPPDPPENGTVMLRYCPTSRIERPSPMAPAEVGLSIGAPTQMVHAVSTTSIPEIALPETVMN